MAATINLGRVVGYSAYEVAVQNGFVGTEEEWLEFLKGQSPFKGWFSDLSELQTKYPEPDDNDYAYVQPELVTDQVEVYEAHNGSWIGTGRSFNPSNNQEFASGENLNEVNIVDNLTDGGSSNVLSARQGRILSMKGFDANIIGALLNCFAHVAWADANASSYIKVLEDALYHSTEVVSLSATFTQGSTVIWSDGVTQLDELKPMLTVMATYLNGVTTELYTYQLSGELVAGTSEITVSFGGETATFNVNVSDYFNIMSWSSNDIVVSQGAMDTVTYNNIAYSVINTTTTTRCFTSVKFGKFLYNKKSNEESIIGKYLMPIPRNATSVTITWSGSASCATSAVKESASYHNDLKTTPASGVCSSDYSTGGTLTVPIVREAGDTTNYYIRIYFNSGYSNASNVNVTFS